MPAATIVELDMTDLMAISDVAVDDDGVRARLHTGQANGRFTVINDGSDDVYMDVTATAFDIENTEAAAALAGVSMRLASGEFWEFKGDHIRPEVIVLKCATGETASVRITKY